MSNPNALPLVYAVVTHWNAYDDTAACLRCVLASDYANLATVVVDNGSTDGSAEKIKAEFPTVSMVHTGNNGSIIEAYNTGMRFGLERDAEHILMLNNDIEFLPNMVSILTNAVTNDPTIGCTIPKIFYYQPSELLWFAGGYCTKLIFSVHTTGEGEPDGPQYSEEKDVDIAYACGMLITRTALEEVGLFDPRFYLYYDDVDISLRILQAGYRIRYLPDAVMWHKVSQTTSGNPRFTQIWARSKMRFFRKHATLGHFVFLVVYSFLHGFFRMLRPLRSNMRMHDHPRAYFTGLIEGLRPVRPSNKL